MALKTSINLTEFTALPDVLKSEYVVQSDGGYKLDLGNFFVTDRDPAGLMSALEKEREESKKAKAAADRLEAEKRKADLDKITDIEQLKLHFTQELEKQQKVAEAARKETERQLLEQRQTAAKQHVRQEAMKLATDLFGPSAPALLPAMEMHFKAVAGEMPSLEIVDPATGKPYLDQSVESLKKSLLTNPIFMPMIVASKASGGSANDGTKGVSAKKADGSPKGFDDYSGAELADILAKNPTEYERLKALR